MTYYTISKDGFITSESESILAPFGTVYPLPEDYEPDKYIVSGDVLVPNPDFEEIKRQKEEDRINKLTMTALDLITAVKSLGLTDEQVESYLNQNLAVKHQLMFCQNVYCGVVRQFCPISIGEVAVTEEQIIALFKAKHGEV